MLNIKYKYLLLLLCIFIFTSCKKEAARTAQTQGNPTNTGYMDTLFLSHIKLDVNSCGAIFSINKSITYPSSHPAAAILSTYNATSNSPPTYVFFNQNVKGDGQVDFNLNFLTHLITTDPSYIKTLDVVDEHFAKTTIIMDSISLNSSYNIYRIYNATAEVSAEILDDNPPTLKFNIKIIKGNLQQGTNSYILDNQNITFSDTYTFSYYYPCVSNCFYQYQNRQYTGNVYLYKDRNRDTLLCNLNNDTLLITNIPTGSFFGTLSFNSFLYYQYSSILFTGPGCNILNFLYSGSNYQFNNTTTLKNTYFTNINHNSEMFYNDTLRLNLSVSATLKTTDLNVLSKNVDTTNSSTYYIFGNYIRL